MLMCKISDDKEGEALPSGLCTPKGARPSWELPATDETRERYAGGVSFSFLIGRSVSMYLIVTHTCCSSRE
jgi:hypothetical protein